MAAQPIATVQFLLLLANFGFAGCSRDAMQMAGRLVGQAGSGSNNQSESATSATPPVAQQPAVTPTVAATSIPLQGSYYASPSGTGSACSLSAPCSLEGVQTKVRGLTSTATSDLTVYLMDGRYDRSALPPLSFTAQDSGKNGRWVTWKANPGTTPIIDGGIHLKQWAPVPGLPGSYFATVPAGTQSRDLWFNGAFRTRASGITNPVGWSFTPTGINTGSSDHSALTNQSSIEAVGFYQWKMFRCPVVSISTNFITMAQPCWRNAIDSGCHVAWGLKAISWLENVGEYIRTPGSWYLNPTNGVVYYTPYPGEDVNTADIVLGKSQKLVDISDADHLVFQGIRFMNTTHTSLFSAPPNAVDGYVSLQAGFHMTGSCVGSRMPGMVDIKNSQQLVFKDNVFVRSGNNGISTDEKSKSNYFTGNGFYSTGAAGIALSWWDPAGTMVHGNIENSFFLNTGRQYWDIPAISTGYISYSSAIHNHIENTYYSGVSWGGGWGAHDGPNLKFSNNILRRTMKGPLNDGGAIYSNQTSTGGVITHNWIDDVGTFFAPNQYALYLDGGQKQSALYNRFDINGSVSGAQAAMINSGGNSITSTYSTVSKIDQCDTRVPNNCKYPGGNYIGNMTYHPNAAPAWADALTREGCSDDSCAGLQAPYMYLLTLSP